jgi:chemotaxis signal transduction protein
MSSLLSSKRNPVAPETSVDVIRCGTAVDVYCLEMSGVANVKPAGDLSSKRGSEPNEPLGFMEHRGQKAPVFDLPNLLGLSRQAGQTGHYVVLIDHPRQTYGIRVASVSRVIRLAQENVLPLPKPLEHVGGWFRGIVDFTREDKNLAELEKAHYLPGISEPKQAISYQRSRHQMQFLLNPATLWPGHPGNHKPAIPGERLQIRYRQATVLGHQRSLRQILIFPAGEIAGRQLMLGLSLSQIVEISEPLTMIPIPHANPAIQGFVQWRSCPVPVINPEASLGCAEATGQMTHLLIVHDPHCGGLIGFPVAGRVQSLRLPIEHRPCAVPDKSWEPYVLGAFELEERLLILPRLDALSGLAAHSTTD